LALIDMIQQHLDDNTISQLSQQLGADPDTTRQAVPAALSAILGGLHQNVQQPGGEQQLENALAEHAGGSGLLGGLGGLLGGGAASSDGGGILSHIFGNHQPAVASQVGQRTGLNSGQAARLLILLAPFVLSYLAKQRQQQQQVPANAGAGAGYAPADGGYAPAGGGSGGGVMGSITDILNGERQRIDQTHPQHSGLFDILGNLAGGILGGR
jgi:hypothetical protein